MAHQQSYMCYGAIAITWRFPPKMLWIHDELHPDGILADVSPAPGRTYTRASMPRGRGRGESLLSPRRLAAKERAQRALHLRGAGYGYAQIAAMLGFKDRSGPWRAIRRLCDRVDYDRYARARMRS